MPTPAQPAPARLGRTPESVPRTGGLFCGADGFVQCCCVPYNCEPVAGSFADFDPALVNGA